MRSAGVVRKVLGLVDLSDLHQHRRRVLNPQQLERHLHCALDQPANPRRHQQLARRRRVERIEVAHLLGLPRIVEHHQHAPLDCRHRVLEQLEPRLLSGRLLSLRHALIGNLLHHRLLQLLDERLLPDADPRQPGKVSSDADVLADIDRADRLSCVRYRRRGQRCV